MRAARHRHRTKAVLPDAPRRGHRVFRYDTRSLAAVFHLETPSSISVPFPLGHALVKAKVR